MIEIKSRYGGRVLYIGRATQLRARVGSYWSHLGDRPHLARMVARIAANGCNPRRADLRSYSANIPAMRRDERAR